MTAIELGQKLKDKFVKDGKLDQDGWTRYLEGKITLAIVSGLMAKQVAVDKRQDDIKEAAAVCGSIHGWLCGLELDVRDPGADAKKN